MDAHSEHQNGPRARIPFSVNRHRQRIGSEQIALSVTWEGNVEKRLGLKSNEIVKIFMEFSFLIYFYLAIKVI